jgi:putative protein-disulfide isomerase
MKKQIIYFFDALCCWCYGFSPVVKRLKEHFSESLDFAVMSGGMVTGARVAPISMMRNYIEQAFPRVEEITGVKFGEAYLANILRKDDYVSNSLPPAVALTVFKSIRPEAQVEFAHDLQSSFYFDGYDLNRDEVYQELAARYGLNADEFVKQIHSKVFEEATSQEFALVKQFGVNGFPSLALVEASEGTMKGNLLAVGYRDFQTLRAAVKSLL